MNTASSREQDFLNAVLENAGALVVVLDHEGRIRRFNKACEKPSGHTFTEIEGKFPWETFLTAAQRQRLRQAAHKQASTPSSPLPAVVPETVLDTGQAASQAHIRGSRGDEQITVLKRMTTVWHHRRRTSS